MCILELSCGFVESKNLVGSKDLVGNKDDIGATGLASPVTMKLHLHTNLILLREPQNKAAIIILTL